MHVRVPNDALPKHLNAFVLDYEVMNSITFSTRLQTHCRMKERVCLCGLSLGPTMLSGVDGEGTAIFQLYVFIECDIMGGESRKYDGPTQPKSKCMYFDNNQYTSNVPNYPGNIFGTISKGPTVNYKS
jgi:hypothetical protein